MKYKLAIFDLDGTILDTLGDLADSTNYALHKNNLPGRSTEEVRCFVGDGIHKLIERAVPESSDGVLTEKVFRDFNNNYKLHCFDSTKPYEGMTECLRKLKDSGMKIAVVSNKADYAVQELCGRFIGGLADVVVGEKENVRRKPYPDSVEHVLAKLEICKNDAVYIGDSDVDIKTALNAGIDEIAVEWGFRDTEFLKVRGADITVESPRELCRLLLD